MHRAVASKSDDERINERKTVASMSGDECKAFSSNDEQR